MPDANDILHATEDLRKAQEQAAGSLSSGGHGLSQGVSSFFAFFKSPDNLLALAVCLVALAGLYRLLRSEHIIPEPRRSGGGLLSSAVAQRLALKLILGTVLAAVGLALLVGRVSGVLEALRQFF